MGKKMLTVISHSTVIMVSSTWADTPSPNIPVSLPVKQLRAHNTAEK